MTLPQPPAVGSLVRTPLGRVAKVIGYDGEDRARLDYESGIHGDVVDLPWKLLRPYHATSAPGVTP